MTTITGLNSLHPISHASLFLDLCEWNAKCSVEEDKKLYEYYIDSLSNRKDCIINVIPKVLELFKQYMAESQRMLDEEAEYQRKVKAAEKSRNQVNGRKFDGLRTSMGTAWNIKKAKVSKKYIEAQREKYEKSF